jgi:dimethylglycine dehydrogenase
LGDDCYYLISAAAAERQDFDLLRSRAARWCDLSVRCVTAEHGVLSVMGPQSRRLLARLTDADLGDSAFPWFTCQTINVAGVPVRAMRVSYVGELGWELHHPILQQPRLFAALVQEGQFLEATLFGAFATNSMRLEKGYRAWGLDLTTERTPLEAGLGPLVKLDDRDFIGRSALMKQSNAKKHMALLEISADGLDPFYLHPVFADDQIVGLVTSGTFGHRTQKKLALAYLDYDSATLDGPPLTTEILGERWPTHILDEPPYDPGNRRIRA